MNDNLRKAYALANEATMIGTNPASAAENSTKAIVFAVIALAEELERLRVEVMHLRGSVNRMR